MRKLSAAIALILAMFLVACTSSNKEAGSASQSTESKKQEAPEYLTGRAAFQKLFVAARSFAPDVQPFRLESVYTDGAPGTEGKEGIWRAEFASPSKKSIKAYTWTGVTTSDSTERGVSHGTEDTYNPANSSTQIFNLNFLKVDSDKAIEVAQKHGGEKLTQKDPKQPVFFVLDFDKRANELIWHVIYGSSRNDSKLVIAVDATTGAYIRTEH